VNDALHKEPDMKNPLIRGWLVILSASALLVGATAWTDGFATPIASVTADDVPVYVVYYWRARTGKLEEYAAYIRDVAEPIDEEARRAGVFEEVRTYTPAFVTGAPGADWTHMRVFKLRNYAALDSFSAGLDAATRRLYPNEATRPSSSGLRDLVRQEMWRDFR